MLTLLLTSLAHAALPAWKHIATSPAAFTVSQDVEGYILTPAADFGCVVVDLTKPTGSNTTPISCPTTTFSLYLRSPKLETVQPLVTVKAARREDGALHVPFVDLIAAVGPSAAVESSLLPLMFGLIPGTLQAEVSIGIVEGTCGDESDSRGCAVSYGEVMFPAGGFGHTLLDYLRKLEESQPQACSSNACDEWTESAAMDERWLKASGCGRQAASDACVAAVSAWRNAVVTRHTAIVATAVDALASGSADDLPIPVAKVLSEPDDSRTAVRQRALDSYAARFDKLAAEQSAVRSIPVAGGSDPYGFQGDTLLEIMDRITNDMAKLGSDEQAEARSLRLKEARKITFIAKFDKAMLAQPALRVQKAPAESPDWYMGEANLERLEAFLAVLDALDTSPQQAARRARFDREAAAQRVLIDAAYKRQQAQEAAEAARNARASGSSSRASSGGGQSGNSCSSPLSGPFGTLTIGGQALTCNILVSQCRMQRPGDVASCMVSTLGPAGISGERCMSCW